MTPENGRDISKAHDQILHKKRSKTGVCIDLYTFYSLYFLPYSIFGDHKIENMKCRSFYQYSS